MKHFLKAMSIIMAFVMLGATFASCSSSTMISSAPEGAKLYMNGELKGTTPYKHTDTAISGASTQITLKKEGYQDFNTILVKNEKVNAGAVIGGLFFLFPFIWTMGYNNTHNYEMTPTQPPLLP